MKQALGTEPSNAPETVPAQPTQPVQKVYRQHTIERQGQRTEPYTHRMPQIRGGICEWCGVKDPNVPSQFQYQLCDHFRGMGEMKCSYCDESVNPTEVVLRSVLNVAEHPDDPNKLVVWCNSYTCSGKHVARFRVNRS